MKIRQRQFSGETDKQAMMALAHAFPAGNSHVVDLPYRLTSWFVMVFAGQAERIRDLEEAGFASQANAGQESWSKVLMQRPAQTPVADYALPAGFIIYEQACDVEGATQIYPITVPSEVARGAMFHRGVYQDLEVYSILRQEVPATLKEALARIGK